MPLNTTSLLGRTPVIPVLTIESAAQAVPLARALLAGGLQVIEVTLRTAAALAAVKAIAAEVPEAVVGVGTVTSPADIEKASRRWGALSGQPRHDHRAGTCAGDGYGAGAARLRQRRRRDGARRARVQGVEILSGRAVRRRRLAQGGGRAAAEHQVLSAGGVNVANAAAYLALSNVVAVGGSWPAPHPMISAGRFDRIEELAREASALRR